MKTNYQFHSGGGIGSLPVESSTSRGLALWRMFMIGCLLVMSLGAKADNFLQAPGNFTAIVQGIDRIRFTLPTQYDGNQNEGIRTGNIYMTIEGGGTKELLTWGLGDGYNELTSDSESGKVTLNAKEFGVWQLVGKVKGGHRYFNKDVNVSFTLSPNDDNSDHFTTTVDWTVPRELRGKKLTFTLWCKSEDIGHSWYIPVGVSDQSSRYKMAEWDVPPAPEVSISMYDPMLAYDTDHAGSIMIPYSVQARKVKSASVYYTDALTGETKSDPLSTKITDIIYLPVDRPWKDIYIKGDVVDTENENVSVTSDEKQSSKMLHFPQHLLTKVMPNGKVQLTWTVSDADQDDFSDGDFFEIQRNVKGLTGANDDGWATIAMGEYFVKGQSEYTFTDSTLLDRYENKSVAYRVRRSATSAWKWSSGSGYALRLLPAILSLPGFNDASVQRTDTWNDEEHLVKFNYTKGPKYDSEGHFIVRTKEDWNEKESLQIADSKTVMVLQNEADWADFARRVKAGANELNAVMLTDIDLQNGQQCVGNVPNPYKGTFKGLGNTLTVNYDGGSVDNVAPFSYVSSATISDLTVSGRITSSGNYTGGLVGQVEGNLTISKCMVNVNIVSQRNGEAHVGGLVGRISFGSTAIINKSAFTGSIQGEKSTHNGGFVGVMSGNHVSLKNCLFAPVALPFNAEGCATFINGGTPSQLEMTDCYYTRVYGQQEVDGKSYFLIQSDKDWTGFAEMVSQAADQPVNAILTTDITVTEMVGTSLYSYNGIFDGNGHTITANINTTLWAGSPFFRVGNAEIKNLTVKGTIVGSRHSSGLVGSGVFGKTVAINNVRVSASITSTENFAGGFVGHGGSATFNINNCRFDGEINLQRTNQYYQTWAGAFIGWQDAGTNNKVTNCYEHGTYVGADHPGFCYVPYGDGAKAWGNLGHSQNNYSWQKTNWGEMGEGYYGKADDSALAAALGSQWVFSNNMALPRMTTADMNSQGTSGIALTSAQLIAALGSSEWRETDNGVAPIMSTDIDKAYNITLWDNRAKFVLQVKMQSDKGTEINEIDLSGDENAILKNAFTYNLTRKCVEYDFNLVIRRGGSPLKIAGTTENEAVCQATKKETGELASYKFMNMNQITNFTSQKKQSSVRLAWETSGGDSDFYRVLRRLHTTDANAEWTDTIATDLVQQFYEDKTVLVQQAYDYRVESVLQCEGIHIASADVKGAECEPTGMVNGYIRMADGTARADVVVYCGPNGDEKQYSTKTDEAGYYEFRGLPYQGSMTYYVSVADQGYTAPNAEGSVVFNTSSNWEQNFNFYLDTYYVYSGHVYYRDTSIPVPGVSFKLDGSVMHDASQQVIITNTEGAFELSIPRGPHRVQAVKDGHFFANDGFLINEDAPEDKTRYNFNKNVANVYLWDSTTVVLRGRVVGGDVQGSLPLGKSLSVNNLGDSLKIVMQLEGDNTSWLIRKQNDETVKSADYEIQFGLDDRNTTKVNVTRHTLTIKPDTETGEYLVRLHPAKYKVIEVSAQGYTTLFQQGKVGETIDLSFNIKGDTCEYNRIYHAVPTLEITQYNPSGEPFYGEKQVTAADNIGNKSIIKTWFWKKTSDTDSLGVYSFKYPIFMGGSPYGWMLQACEKYYYNNSTRNKLDMVNLSGGKVSIKNGLIGTADTKEMTLDDKGGASYVFTPQNTTFLLSGDDALKSVSITLEYDNSFYDIKPMDGDIFKGYVMSTLLKPEGRKSVVAGIPMIVDYLRDPPGGNSSAYLEAGSKLSYTYNADFSGALGTKINFITGKNAKFYNGSVVAPPNGVGTTAGTYQDSKKSEVLSVDAVTYFSQGWNFSYNFDVTERIQTSSSKKWIGEKADLFIGMTTEVLVSDAIALRVVPDSMYQIYKTHEGGSFKATDSLGNTATIKVLTGTAKVLAEGVDDTGKPVYLLRDEVMAVGPKLASTFVHSHHYIENELLPELIKLRNSLILPKGTSPEYAKALAVKKGYPTYISRVAENDVSFGYHDTYDPYVPDDNIYGDSIKSLNQTVEAWLNILTENERQKIEVLENDLVKRYDFDGGANVQYSESFSCVQAETRSLRFPGVSVGTDGSGLLGPLAQFVSSILNSAFNSGVGNQPEVQTIDDNGNQRVEVSSTAAYFALDLKPVFTLNFTDKNGTSQTNSKKVGFTLSASSKSSLTVDVYRTANEQTMSKKSGFGKITADVLENLRNGVFTDNLADFVGNSEKVYSSFVYRTRAGVTCEPYEKERVTKWYQPGTVIDVATVPADKPRIWIDEPVVSNVPMDQPARFTLHMANESEYPERASLVFNYYLLASSNPNGAKVLVEGAPINSQGVNIVLYPCRDKQNEVVVFTKEIEVWPGKEFDYNDLTLCLYDPEDANRVFDCKFSAHFIPAAGTVNVSSPGDKWVMNTESPYDGKRKDWYMPVRIDGFDTNYRGFDHIELQYKLSTQGDKDWVNVCSYYADKELMKKASGVTDTIPGDGIILARFYGEAGKVEQYYDVRAVNYCRHAGGFLTTSSPILKGIKDTRRPELFGHPEPTDGILGYGDDLKLTFSEAIAGNYLSAINNFELLGTPNNRDISTSTSIMFDGEQSMIVTQGSRNLSGKSFTVDVMLNPSPDGGDMTVFRHGGDENAVLFGLTKDRHLSATVNGTTVVSDEKVDFSGILHEVAYALDQSGDDMKVIFFDEKNQIGSKTLSGKYENTADIVLGYDLSDWEGAHWYKGDMLELRIWNRALTSHDLDQYGNKQLTGNESGLQNYYPMNEGDGEFVYDHAAGGMDLMALCTSWKRPDGISMKFDGTKGLIVDKNPFVRSRNHDYTLSFWFKTTDSDATLFSNGDASIKPENPDSINEINIGIEKGIFFVRSNGWQKNIGEGTHVFNDGKWHQFVMGVSRSRNVANVYMDQKVIESFAADSLAGISSDHIALGATYVNKAATKLLKGNIDEVGMFASVLPVQLINEFATHTPIGSMTSMLAYLNFERSERQDNNTMRLMPTGISLKQYKDNQANILARRDTLLRDIDETFVDRNLYAPMVSTSKLDNLKFKYVVNDNQLVVNIEEPDYLIEKTNLYLTVKEIPDLQGNTMESPVTMNIYVNRNPLRWNVKSVSRSIKYGEGLKFDVTLSNQSGVRQEFDLQNLPIWMTASQTSGVIDALNEMTITFEVSPYINIGTYTEQVELISGSQITEPLPITLMVRGEEPLWVVSDRLKRDNQTMMMVARVKIDGMVANSPEDILGVFDADQETRGVAHIEVDNTNNANDALAYVTIYRNTSKGNNQPLNFKFFDASTGEVFIVKPSDGKTYSFQKDAVVGSAGNPVVLESKWDDNMQVMKLKAGWNWVTIGVEPNEGTTVGQFLNTHSKWEVGDVISVLGTSPKQWTCRENKSAERKYKWDHEDEPITIDSKQMYRIYSMSEKSVFFEGESQIGQIPVRKGWNRIGYLSTINLPVAQALSDYTEKASEGDIIKSQEGFAVACSTPSGLIWKGSLHYLEAGKGYMLKRLDNSETTFYYPYYYTENRYSDDKNASRFESVNTANTMNIVATVSGVDIEENDKLVVYCGAEKLTEAVADDEQLYYLNIGRNEESAEKLTFIIERDGELVAMTGSDIVYAADKVMGTPNEPTDINFTEIDQTYEDGKWYTTSGIQLPNKPTRSGLYIHNGKVIIIK